MKQPCTSRPTVWIWLTLPIAVLLMVATGSELFVAGLSSTDAPTFVAQAVGQDVVTLAVALPVLVVGGVFASRDSDRPVAADGCYDLPRRR